MRRADPFAGRRCVVAGGAGAVGAMVADLLRGAGAHVLVVDPRAATAGGDLRGDVTAPAHWLAVELARADVVVLAVPEPVVLEAVDRVAAAMRPGALLVDTASVKGRVVAAERAHAAHLEAVSLNPLFAPSLGLDGRAVAAVLVHDGPGARALLGLVGRRGGRVVRVSAAEHDRIAGATQALTHAAVLAFGLALSELDVDGADLRALGPPPHATLLALLARIASGRPETYWDVQAANPHAAPARAALAAAARRLADLVDQGDEPAFAAVLAGLRAGLGPDLDHHRRACEQAFRQTTERTA